MIYIAHLAAMYDAPDSTSTVTGSSASLTCVVSSAKEATITWSTTLDSDISSGVATSFNSVRYFPNCLAVCLSVCLSLCLYVCFSSINPTFFVDLNLSFATTFVIFVKYLALLIICSVR